MSVGHAVLIAWSFPPISGVAGYRPLRVAKILAQKGWEVTVVSAYPSNTTHRMNSPDLEAFIPPEVSVIRLPDTATSRAAKPSLHQQSRMVFARIMRKSFRELRKLSTRFRFPEETLTIANTAQCIGYPKAKVDVIWHPYILAYLRNLHHAHPIDVLWATTPPMATGFVTYVVSQQLNIPYLLDYRDLWLENPYCPESANEQQVEKTLLDSAHKVTAVTQGFTDVLSKKTNTPVQTIYNGFDPELFVNNHTDNRPSHTSSLSIVHVGTLYEDNDLAPLVEAINSCTDDIELHFYGDINASTERLIRGNPDILAPHGFVVSSRAHQALHEADIALVAGIPHNPSTIRAKIYEALALKKPVIYFGDLNDEAALILQKCGLLLCASRSPADLEKSLQHATSRKQQGLSLCEPHESIIETFSTEGQAPLICQIFEDTLT